MPILWGDRLVVVNGLWFEDPATEAGPVFREALGRGIVRLMRDVGAERLDANGIEALRGIG